MNAIAIPIMIVVIPTMMFVYSTIFVLLLPYLKDPLNSNSYMSNYELKCCIFLHNLCFRYWHNVFKYLFRGRVWRQPMF